MIKELTPRFEITGILSRSTTGTLYAAEDKVMRRSVAIKVLPRALGKGALAVVESAASALARINHPNVASVYEFGETAEGISYVVLERVNGPSVAELLRQGSLTVNESVEIAASVAGALNAIHSRGIIHLDIRPSNILIQEPRKAILTDFGLPKRIRGTEVQQLVNDILMRPDVSGREMADALTYMAPEQVLRAASPGTSTDMFSLGVTIYETLTGRLPYSGKTAEETAQETIEQILYSGMSPAEVVRRMLATNPSRPSTFNPSVPEPLDFIVLKALAREPERRYETADELLTALGSAREAVSIAGESGRKGAGRQPPTKRVPRGSAPDAPPAEPPPAPMLYFVLEGERAREDVVECGSDVDLIFNYAIPPADALVSFWGKRFEKILKGEVALGVTVIATGFTFRDGIWHRVANFSGGALAEPLRFHLRAAGEVVDEPGFFVTLSLYESILYQLPVSVRLVESLDAPAQPAQRRWALDLDLYEIISEKESTLGASGAGR